MISEPSGEPVPGARVCAFCDDCFLGPGGYQPTCVATDALGVYELQGLGTGSYRLSAGAPGYRPSLVDQGRVLHIGQEGLRADGIDGVLEPGGALVIGVAMDGTGGPVAGATVEAHFLPDEAIERLPIAQTAVSDEDGAFSLSVPHGGVRLMARAEGYAPGDVYTTAPATNIRLVMTPSAAVSGHVVTLDGGRAVANVRVNAERRGVEQFATSDDTGAFRIGGLRPGTFTLTAMGNGWIGEMSGTVSVGLGDHVGDLLVHVLPGVRVRGSVHVGDAPCAAGKATLTPAPGQSLPRLDARPDREGRVEFEAVPPGVYNSQAACDHFGQAAGPQVRVGEQDVDGVIWRLRGGAQATVVATTTGGMPAVHTAIDLAPVFDPEKWVDVPPEGKSGWTDEQGEIAFQGLRQLPYRISGPDIAEPVEVQVRGDDNRFEVSLDARGYVELTVRSQKGEPNDEVGVYALGVSSERPPTIGQRHDTGLYRIGPLPGGTYELNVRDGVNPAVQLSGVEVTAGAVTPVELTYGGFAGSISGRVRDEAGDPVPNIWVSAESTDSQQDGFTRGLEHMTRAQQRRVYTDARGRFEIPGLDPTGSFAVVVTRALGGEERRAPVSAGQQVELVLPRTASVAGRVVDGDGEPARRFQLALYNADTRQALRPIFGPDAAGSFHIEEVTAGELRLVASSPGGQQASTRVEVAAGQQLEGIVMTLSSMQPAQLARGAASPP